MSDSIAKIVDTNTQETTKMKSNAEDIQAVTHSFVHRPRPIKVINKIGQVLERIGLSHVEKSEKSILKRACIKTGLSDFGDDTFLEPLRVLKKAVKKDGNLNYFGWMIFNRMLTHHLINRLKIQEELKKDPEITNLSIKDPLFIVCLPRTGTTLLQRLLSLDPVNRSLLYWEALSPAPAPRPETRDTDPRIQSTEKVLKAANSLSPLMQSIHPMKAKEPDECYVLFMNSFMTPFFAIAMYVPDYMKWLDQQDMTQAYRYYRQQLQILQSKFSGERWVLKSPYHLYSLNALADVIPDARILQLHRDPCKVTASFCSLMAASWGIYTDQVDPALIGRLSLDILSDWMERNRDARKQIDPSQLFDVQYKDLVQHPTDTVKKIYNHFGYDFTPSYEEALKKWLAEDSEKRNKQGTHNYSLEQFGLNPAEVNERFEKYIHEFNIPKEG